MWRGNRRRLLINGTASFEVTADDGSIPERDAIFGLECQDSTNRQALS